MNKSFKKIIFTLLSGILLFSNTAWSLTSDDSIPQIGLAHNADSTQTIDHSEWQKILDKHLIKDADNATYFDYQGLVDNGAKQLNAYVSSLTALNPTSLNRSEQFAYWVNLYNALTVKLIGDNYPVKSITKLGEGFFSFGPWDDVVTSIAGKEITLNMIEHKILRPIWKDHRIHFAVNCASIGCPNLQPTAFNAANSETLLTAAAKEFVQHSRGVDVNGDRMLLSKIFSWYEEDFGDSQSEMLKVLRQYMSADQQSQFDAALKKNTKVKYDYDWNLNDSAVIK